MCKELIYFRDYIWAHREHLVLHSSPVWALRTHCVCYFIAILYYSYVDQQWIVSGNKNCFWFCEDHPYFGSSGRVMAKTPHQEHRRRRAPRLPEFVDFVRLYFFHYLNCLHHEHIDGTLRQCLLISFEKCNTIQVCTGCFIFENSPDFQCCPVPDFLPFSTCFM